MLQQLSRLADAQGKSRHEYAKQLVIAGLSNSFQETTSSVLLELRHDLNLLREEHITATNALLVTAGRMTPERARRFIEEQLLKRSAPDA